MYLIMVHVLESDELFPIPDEIYIYAWALEEAKPGSLLIIHKHNSI